MSRTKGSKNKPKHHDGVSDPSGLRAVGKKLAADEKAQTKLPIASRDVVPTREEIELPHALSATEVGHINGRVMSLEVEITAMAKELNDLQTEARGKAKEIAKKRKEVSKLAAEAHTKTRWIPIPVRIENDYGLAQKRYFRLDRGPREIGELYDTKAMPPEEREQAVFAPRDGDRVVVGPDPTPEPVDGAPEQVPVDANDEPPVNAKGGES